MESTWTCTRGLDLSVMQSRFPILISPAALVVAYQVKEPVECKSEVRLSSQETGDQAAGPVCAAFCYH